MKNQKFELLKKKYPEDAAGKDGDNEEIKLLRGTARALREENNKVVHELWDISFKLKNDKSPLAPEERASLLKSQKELADKSEKYIQQLNDLREQIKQMEIKLYGVSEINSNSPYEL